VDKNAFGFFNVEVKAPVDLNVPLLQTKIKTEKGGIRTVAAVGS
jgi:hypothetical protein